MASGHFQRNILHLCYPIIQVKTLLIRAAALLAWPSAAYSQVPATAPRPTISSFFKADFSPSTSDDSTAFCAETIYRDSLSGVTRVYYPAGRLKEYVPYADVRQRMVHGSLTTWYEDGTMRTKEDYVGGRRHGELLTYYPDGTLKRRDHFENGRSGVGNCYASDGTYVPYFAYEQLPLYPGGDDGLINEVERGLQRNLNSKERAVIQSESHRTAQSTLRIWKREVLVQLVVAEDGRVSDYKVVQSNAPMLNNAVLRSVAKLTRQFIPARRDGQAVVSYLVVPVKYTLPMPTGQDLFQDVNRPSRRSPGSLRF